MTFANITFCTLVLTTNILIVLFELASSLLLNNRSNLFNSAQKNFFQQIMNERSFSKLVKFESKNDFGCFLNFSVTFSMIFSKFRPFTFKFSNFTFKQSNYYFFQKYNSNSSKVQLKLSKSTPQTFQF